MTTLSTSDYFDYDSLTIGGSLTKAVSASINEGNISCFKEDDFFRTSFFLWLVWADRLVIGSVEGGLNSLYMVVK